MARRTELLSAGPPDRVGEHMTSNQIPFETPYNNFL